MAQSLNHLATAGIPYVCQFMSQLPARGLGKQEAAQALGSRTSTQESWVKLLLPNFRLFQPRVIIAFGE